MYMFTDLIAALVREVVLLIACIVAAGMFLYSISDRLLWWWGFAWVAGAAGYLAILLLEGRPYFPFGGVLMIWVDRTFPFIHFWKGRRVVTKRRRFF